METRLTLLVFLILAAQAWAQPGSSCPNPMPILANAGVQNRVHNTGSNNLWMAFTATHSRMSIRVSAGQTH